VFANPVVSPAVPAPRDDPHLVHRHAHAQHLDRRSMRWS